MVNDPHKKTGPLGRFSQAPSALAPIEDDYFLQVDFPGSKPVLMPPTNMYPTLHQRPGNTDEYTTSGYSLLVRGDAVPKASDGVGQLRAPQINAEPHCPTSISTFSYIESK
jgi:hypothetical protein